MKNNERYDLSDRLIHFFRPFDLSDSSVPCLPELWGWNNIDEGEHYPAFFLLRSVIRNCWIWYTWSYRNNARSIYGPYPATCFTEMPLAAFIEASKERSSLGQKISTYALVFKKNDLFKMGARPVIYGLSDSSIIFPGPNDGKKRIIDASYLAIKEQYRYVTFNPASEKPVDWSHEREWRLPFFEYDESFEEELMEDGPPESVRDIPGFEINKNVFSEIGVITTFDREVPFLIHDILTLVDRAVFRKNTIKYIISAESINNIIELRDPHNERNKIEESIVDIESYFIDDEIKANTVLSDICDMETAIEDSFPTEERGEFGGCWLWFHDNRHELTRLLVSINAIEVSKDGRYLYYPLGISEYRSLSQKEEMVKQLSEKVSGKYQIECGYFSVLGKMNYDEVPFYCDIPNDENYYYNTTYAKI